MLCTTRRLRTRSLACMITTEGSQPVIVGQAHTKDFRRLDMSHPQSRWTFSVAKSCVNSIRTWRIMFCAFLIPCRCSTSSEEGDKANGEDVLFVVGM